MQLSIGGKSSFLPGLPPGGKACQQTCYLEGMLLHGLDDILKEYLCGQGVAMVD